MEEDRGNVLQWHPAFYADIQIEFQEESHKLMFQNEYPLSKKPMLVDILVIKKRPGEKIQKNIGRIFRTYNLIEYKSPTDYLSVDDFYKVYGYACFYKADTGKTNEIPAEEITITFVAKNYPRKMIQHLLDARKYTIEKIEPGIYYVYGDVFAIQIIVTGQLLPKHNLWLYSLTDTLTDSTITRKLLNEYRGKEKDTLYSAAMQVIVAANEHQFKEEENMCDALMKIINELSDEKAEIKAEILANERVKVLANERVEALANERAEVLANEKAEILVKEKTEKLIAGAVLEGKREGRLEGKMDSIKNLIESLKVTADQAMDLLKIPFGDREAYKKAL